MCSTGRTFFLSSFVEKRTGTLLNGHPQNFRTKQDEDIEHNAFFLLLCCGAIIIFRMEVRKKYIVLLMLMMHFVLVYNVIHNSLFVCFVVILFY